MTATTSLRMRSVARSTNAPRRMAKKSRCCAVNSPGTMTHSARAMPVTLETLDGWHGTRAEDGRAPRKELHVLWTIFVVLLVLWALGVVSSYTLNGFIHILLVVALVVV